MAPISKAEIEALRREREDKAGGLRGLRLQTV